MNAEVEIDGKMMKPCPGWDGNGFRCGRGSPRMIDSTREVCENCGRGMRKAGQRSRKEIEEAEQKKLRAKRRLEKGVELVNERLGKPIAKAPLAEILEALSTLTQGDLGETYGYWKDREIPAEDRFRILRLATGLDLEAGDEPDDE